MPNFCPNCGAKLDAAVKFCPNCGAATAAPAQPQQPTYQQQAYQQPVYQQPQQPVYQQAGAAPTYAAGGEVRVGIPAPGFSDRVNHPEILAAVQKSRKTAATFAFFLVPLPLIGFLIYSLFSNDMETSSALLYGALVSGVFLAFALYSFVKERATYTYEATVIDKKSRRAYRRNSSDDRSYYTEYIIVVRTADGKKKKIVEREGSQLFAWDYLNVGDRFKYHPQFHFPYELYDKSRAPYLVCVSCSAKHPVDADRCQKCGLPLLK